ncbi:class I SAM-dependent methyltransferase [Variovorax sp. RT4R15]|uniref:class I SAM-dependent methyltransferase n=1 Tax=Variovorax sp. RT4R15 TaxID=3443737 RepID=UPI003F4664DB
MLKSLAKTILRPLWEPIRRRVEFVVRNELDRRPMPAVTSTLCKQSDFSTEWYLRWKQIIADAAPELDVSQAAVWGKVWDGMEGKWLHRKLWEWCAVAQALEERGMLEPRRTGIGFAVGQEPLPSLFAKRGVDLVASDFHGDGAEPTWATTGQLGQSLDAIHWPGVLSAAEFGARATYQNIDMRNLSALPRSAFDFSWSSCSFEHLGSLDAGLQFLVDSLECLKPGGIAVHTTEFNISSNDTTVEEGSSVIYRRKDIESFEMRLRNLSCAIEALNFDAGSEQHDIAYDYPPYYTHGRQHLKLQLDGYISTSLLLIIRKAA